MPIKRTKTIMSMPVTVEIVDASATEENIDNVFSFFAHIDEVFSTYKPQSEITRINKREILPQNYSQEMQEVFKLCQETKNQTQGYFNIQRPDGQLDPSGLVKGWAIFNAAKILAGQGYANFYVEAGGDVQTSGKNSQGAPWSVGIKNPFAQNEIVKVVYLNGQGLATSGSYIRGQHIYNPHNPQTQITDIVSLSVIGPNIYEADRFATAAFAMGKQGIYFIEQQPGLEGYTIDSQKLATQTSGFGKYTLKNWANY